MTVALLLYCCPNISPNKTEVPWREAFGSGQTGGADAWELRIYLGRDPSGKVRHRSILFRGTKRSAGRELARLVAEQDRSPAVVPHDPGRPWGPNTTVNDAIEGWRANGWDDLSPSTVRRYESMVKVHITTSIGRRRIAGLGPYDVERYFRDLKAAGLSQASVRQIRAVLHRSCRLARKWSSNTLPNPITDTELPDWSIAEAGPAVRSPTLEEVRQLLLAAHDNRDYRVPGFVRLVAATGLLRWTQLDPSKKNLGYRYGRNNPVNVTDTKGTCDSISDCYNDASHDVSNFVNSPDFSRGSGDAGTCAYYGVPTAIAGSAIGPAGTVVGGGGECIFAVGIGELSSNFGQN